MIRIEASGVTLKRDDVEALAVAVYTMSTGKTHADYMTSSTRRFSLTSTTGDLPNVTARIAEAGGADLERLGPRVTLV